eukprot:1138403-Pelagomonas_calceolata.AAC.3
MVPNISRAEVMADAVFNAKNDAAEGASTAVASGASEELSEELPRTVKLGGSMTWGRHQPKHWTAPISLGHVHMTCCSTSMERLFRSLKSISGKMTDPPSCHA